MIDRDQIRQQLFQVHGVKVDRQDPLMVHLLINDALWQQMDETLKLMVSGIETRLEDLYARGMQESKGLGEEMVAIGAKGSAQEVERALKAALGVLQQEVDRSVESLQAAQVPLSNTVAQIRAYYDDMFKMYAFLIYLSAGLGAGIVAGLGLLIAILGGWL